MAQDNDSTNLGSENSPKSNPGSNRLRWMLLVLGGVLLAQYALSETFRPKEIAYSAFLKRVDAGEVEAVQVGSNALTVRLTKDAKDTEKAEDGKPKLIHVNRLPGVDDTELVDSLKSKGIELRGDIDDGPGWWSIALIWLLPIVLMGLLYSNMMRSALGGGKGGPLSFGRSRAKIHDQSAANPVRFTDVAGQEEAKQELTEVVDFLKDSSKYKQLGARIPRGVMLVGPPGTGKTLMARAVAGESGVPFFSLSGSDFVEMFVGVGAARVRDLFQQAKGRAPCIIFIDELDAIGKSRGGVGAMATHDEREQTLNQLLAEMDGFDQHTEVIIIAASNRPEVLDKALLRAGRFDRQVVLDRPDLAGREAILRVHARKVPLAEEVNLRVVAQRTPGMSGADLANVVNEAALCAARHDHTQVERADFEESIDRMQLGLKKQGRAMNEEEKRRVAFHEAGHALVAMHLKHADPVHRVTIIPRSIGALGATLQLPTEDRYLVTGAELHDKLAVMMGGRAAEQVMFEEISSGASNDLERATETARQMVTRFGMSAKLGPQTFGRSNSMRFLEGIGPEERNYSESTAEAIDAEVRQILLDAEARAQQVLRKHQSELKAIVDRLLDEETLERGALLELVRRSTAPDENAAKN